LIDADSNNLNVDGDCDIESADTTMLHAVNLPVLYKFYDLINSTLVGQSLQHVDQLVDLEPLDIPLLSANVSHLLAADTEVSYQLNKVADALTNSSVVFHSPSEVMLYDLLRQQAIPSAWTLDLHSWQTWLVGGLYILTIISFIYHYRITRRLAYVQAVTAGALRVLPQTDAYDLRSIGKTTTTVLPTITTINTTMVFSFDDIINQIRHIDIAIMIIFFVVSVCSVITITHAIHTLRARRSFLYIEIKGNAKVMHVYIMTLPTATRQYGVLLPSAGVRLNFIDHCLFGKLIINTPEWHIFDKLTEQTLSAPRHVCLFLPKIKILRDIIAADFTTTLL
jgi:hypothetical protein